MTVRLQTIVMIIGAIVIGILLPDLKNSNLSILIVYGAVTSFLVNWPAEHK